MKFNEYPYLNLSDLNLDYILNAIKEMQYEVTNFVSINAIKYADPIQWSIIRQYEKNTIVIDPVSGTAYISVAPVPAGVALTRPEYWTVVFDLSLFIVRAAKNFTTHYEADTTLTATFPTNTGGWLVWGDTLYKALTNITAGDSYVIGGNIEHFTIEDLYNEYLNTVALIYSAIDDLTANIHDAFTYSNENENVTFSVSRGNGAMFWWHGKLYRTTAAVNAGDVIDVGTNCERFTMEMALVDISNSLTSIRNNIGNLADLTTTDTSNLVNAINEIVANLAAFKNEVGELSDITVPSPTDYADAINKVWARVLAVEHRVDIYHTTSAKKAILISDSYGESPSIADNWGTYFESITGVDSTMYAYSGKGFYTNGVNSILSSFSAENIPNKPEYTDIVCCCGANDVATVLPSDITNLISAIVDFCNYCKTNFPNANVYIGMCGYCIYGMPAAGTGNTVNYLNVLAAYQLGAASGDAHFLSGVEFPLHYYANISFVDGIHPTSAGAQALGRAIASAWHDGSYSYKGDGEFLRLTPVSGGTLNESSSEVLCGLAYVENEVTWWQGFEFTFVFASGITIGNTFVDIATITTPRAIYGNGNTIDIPVTVQAISDIEASGIYVNVPMIARIQNGKLKLKSLYINSGAWEDHSFTTIIMSLPNQQLMTLVN